MENKSNSLRYDYHAKIFLMAHSFYSLDRILKIFLDLSFLTLAYLSALFTRSEADISSSLTLFCDTWPLVLPLHRKIGTATYFPHLFATIFQWLFISGFDKL
ncbi:MAG: hypothetical protein AABY92_04415 [Thermodesulfobacteriota bacterium]